MGIGTVLLIGVGLSMDAVAVSLSNAMTHREAHARLVEMALFFGLFQAVMPLGGWVLGGAFSQLITRLGGVLVLGILGFIGYRMLKSGLCVGDACPLPVALTHRLLLIQAVATSIDAFAVGVGFRTADIDVPIACALIGLTTAALSLLACAVGRRFGDRLGKKAEVLGGVLLIALGVQALF